MAAGSSGKKSAVALALGATGTVKVAVGRPWMGPGTTKAVQMDGNREDRRAMRIDWDVVMIRMVGGGY